jgi:hypothetical protein
MTWWALGFAFAAVVVLVVAVLLLAIIRQCRRIVRLAGTGLGVVEDIDRNTRCIWSLRATEGVADRLLEGADGIERKTAAIARALDHDKWDRAA